MLAQKLMLIAIAIIFMGIILLIIASIITLQQSKQQNKVEVGFGGFIGFFPFGFFTSKKAFWMWVAIVVLAAIFFLIWFLSKKQ